MWGRWITMELTEETPCAVIGKSLRLASLHNHTACGCAGTLPHYQNGSRCLCCHCCGGGCPGCWAGVRVPLRVLPQPS